MICVQGYIGQKSDATSKELGVQFGFWRPWGRTGRVSREREAGREVTKPAVRSRTRTTGGDVVGDSTGGWGGSRLPGLPEHAEMQDLEELSLIQRGN